MGHAVLTSFFVIFFEKLFVWAENNGQNMSMICYGRHNMKHVLIDAVSLEGKFFHRFEVAGVFSLSHDATWGCTCKTCRSCNPSVPVLMMLEWVPLCHVSLP